MENIDLSKKRTAIIAGIGLLLMTVLAVFANMYVLPKLVVPVDAVKTVENIMGSGGLFRVAVCSFLIVIILDVIVAWALYVLLKSANSNLSLLTAWFRIIYAVIFAVALSNFLDILQLLNGNEYLQAFVQAFETNELNAYVMLSFNTFEYVWNIGFVFFGLHLGLLGYISWKSDYIPKVLGILLIISGVGYLTDSIGKLFFIDYNIEVSAFTFVGELLLMFWLFWKGITGFKKKAKK